MLVELRDGRPLALRQTGLFTRELYPKLLEMLLNIGMAYAAHYFAFRFGLHQTIDAAHVEDVIAVPRVRYRDIILSRKQWWIRKALLPQRAPAEDLCDYFLRLDGWRRAYGITQRAFVRRHSSDKVLDRDTSSGKKPLFVDFAAPIMARMVARVFNTSFDWLSIEEMIPDDQDRRAAHERQCYASEVLFEVKPNDLF